MMNPGVAYSLFRNYMFKEPFQIKSIFANAVGKDNVKFPMFYEYNLDCPMEFKVMEWHNHFDALIGSADLLRLGARIDYREKVITFGNKKLPFSLQSFHKEPDVQISQDTKSSSTPVDIQQCDTYVPNSEHKDLHLSDSVFRTEDHKVVYPTETDNVTDDLPHIKVNMNNETDTVEPSIRIDEYLPKTDDPIIHPNQKKFSESINTPYPLTQSYTDTSHSEEIRPFTTYDVPSKYTPRRNDQFHPVRRKQLEPKTSTFSPPYKIRKTEYVTNPLNKDKESKDLYFDETDIKTENDKIRCKMKTKIR